MNCINYLLFTFVAFVMITAASCEQDPIINTPEEEADRIRANTPTELPPITMTGENTMGAWIIPQPGSELHQLAGTDSILFVASGVERIDRIGASSTDCNAFQNYRYESRGSISIIGNWCSRPEIGDPHAQVLSISYLDEDYALLFYSYDSDGGSTVNRLRFVSDTIYAPDYEVLRNDAVGRTLSLTFSSTLISSEGDSIKIATGRLDATYGSTP